MNNLNGVKAMLSKEYDRLSREMKAVSAALSAFGAAYGNHRTGRSKMSAAAKARIPAAQKARWAKVKAGSKNRAATAKRTMSASARRRIAVAQRARWAKLKAAKKS